MRKTSAESWIGAPAELPGQLQAGVLLNSLSFFELFGVARQRAVTTSPRLIMMFSTGQPIKEILNLGMLRKGRHEAPQGKNGQGGGMGFS